MSKIVLVMPAVRIPKCENCKWSARFDKDTLICSTFKVKPSIKSRLYDFSQLYDLTYCIDTEIARGDVQFCGYYGTHFELKDGNP